MKLWRSAKNLEIFLEQNRFSKYKIVLRVALRCFEHHIT